MSDFSNYKFKRILRVLENKESFKVLDIGGSANSVKSLIKNTEILDLNNNADYKFNLIDDFIKNNKILKFKDNSYDLVVASQILEHVINPVELLNECFRISSKYVLISLPNDLTIDNRLRFLFNKCNGFDSLGHKQVLNYIQINDFVKVNCNKYNNANLLINEFNWFAIKGGRFLPSFVRDYLALKMPNLFCKEKFWLFEKVVFFK